MHIASDTCRHNVIIVCIAFSYLKMLISLFRSKKHIHLDKWHKVTVKRNGKTGEMSVDGHTAVTGEASVSTLSLFGRTPV